MKFLTPLARRRVRATKKTLNDLAAEMKISAGNLSQIEQGKAPLGATLKLRLATRYKCSELEVEFDYLRGRVETLADEVEKSKARLRELKSDRKVKRAGAA